MVPVAEEVAVQNEQVPDQQPETNKDEPSEPAESLEKPLEAAIQQPTETVPTEAAKPDTELGDNEKPVAEQVADKESAVEPTVQTNEYEAQQNKR